MNDVGDRLTPLNASDGPELERSEEIVSHVLVRWFDAARGFGFVIPTDGRTDAFLHSSVLREVGLTSLSQGDRLRCVIDHGHRGLQVRRILAAPGVNEQAVPGKDNTDVHLIGRVKFYDAGRGYGFIRTESGEDVFVGAKLLKKLGLTPLREDQAVKLTVIPGEKSLIVETLTFFPSEGHTVE